MVKKKRSNQLCQSIPTIWLLILRKALLCTYWFKSPRVCFSNMISWSWNYITWYCIPSYYHPIGDHGENRDSWYTWQIVGAPTGFWRSLYMNDNLLGCLVCLYWFLILLYRFAPCCIWVWGCDDGWTSLLSK